MMIRSCSNSDYSRVQRNVAMVTRSHFNEQPYRNSRVLDNSGTGDLKMALNESTQADDGARGWY